MKIDLQLIILFFIFTNLAFGAFRARSFGGWRRFSVLAEEPLSILFFVAGFFATHTHEKSLVSGILPLMFLAFFAAYRKQNQEVRSISQFLAPSFGFSVRTVVGWFSFLFSLLLLFCHSRLLWQILNHTTLYHSFFFLLLGLYLLLPLWIGGANFVAWNQLGLVIVFVFFSLFPSFLETSNQSEVPSMDFFSATDSLFSIGVVGSMFCIMPLDFQGIWVTETPKIIKRGYVTTISIALLVAFLLYGSSYNHLHEVLHAHPVYGLFCSLFVLQHLFYRTLAYFTQDVLSPLFQEKITLKRGLGVTRMIAPFFLIFVGVVSYFSPMIPFFSDVIILLALLIQVPFCIALFNIKSNWKEFAWTSFAIIVSYIVVRLSRTYLKYQFAPPFAFGVGLITFLSLHYAVHRKINYIKLSFRENKRLSAYYITKDKIKKFFSLYHINAYLKSQVDSHGVPYTLVGIFLSLGFCVAPILQKGTTDAQLSHINALTLVGGLLSMGLFLYPVWGTKFSRFFSYYWYGTLIYALSFYHVVAYLICGQSLYMLLNIAFAPFFFARFIPGRSFWLFHLLGTLEALLYYHFVIPGGDLREALALQRNGGYLAFYAYGISFLISYLFLRGRHYTLSYTEKALSYLSQEFLHLNTNIVGMAKSPATQLEWILNTNLKEVEEKGGQVHFTLEKDDYEKIKECLQDVRQYIDQGSEIIRRRSKYFAPIKKDEFDKYRAHTVVLSALEIFHRLDTSQSTLPKVVCEKDFTFYGSAEHLEQAVLNLIATTFAHCEEDVPKEITIKENKIVYRYYGRSISNRERRYLFTYLAYTEKESGYYKEVGALPYVKRVMEAFDGDIHWYCHYDKNPAKSYTTFTLTFPVVQKSRPKKFL